MSDIQTILERGLADVQQQVRTKHAELDAKFIELAQKGDNAYGTMRPQTKTLGSIVTGDAGLAALRDRRVKSAIIPADLSLKTLVNGAGDSNTTGFDTQAQRMPGVANAPRRRLSLLDVLPVIPVSSSSFEFVALDGFTNAAAYQLTEGSAKAQQDMPTETVTAAIATVAVVLPASEQVLADNPSLGQFIDQQLRYGVLSKLEAELINGAGGSGRMLGLLTQATAFVPSSSGTAGADAIGEAAAALEADGWNPGVIVLHPEDWQAIRAERTQAGEYVASPWSAPAGPSLWGLPVVTTAAMTKGDAIVMDPAQTALLDRQSVNVMTGYVGDQFAENAISIRCELRNGLAVFAPSAVLSVAL